MESSPWSPAVTGRRTRLPRVADGPPGRDESSRAGLAALGRGRRSAAARQPQSRRVYGLLRVHPTLVPKGSAIAGVDGVMNGVALETDHVHELLLAGPGAGGPPTATVPQAAP